MSIAIVAIFIVCATTRLLSVSAKQDIIHQNGIVNDDGTEHVPVRRSFMAHRAPHKGSALPNGYGV
jgi:hypothetical protein